MTQVDEITLLITALEGDADQRAEAQAQLARLGARAVGPLVKVLASQNRHQAWAAAEVLGDLVDPGALPALVAALRSPHALLSIAAIKALLKYQHEDILPWLIEALPHMHIMAQQTLIVALQDRGDSRAVPALLDLLKNAPSPAIRTALIQTLGKLGDRSIVPDLSAYLDDENHHVRQWSAKVMKQLTGGPPEC